MNAYLFAGLSENEAEIFKLLHEKFGKAVSPKLLEKILKMEDWQLSLLLQDQNPFVSQLKNFDGPYFQAFTPIQNHFSIDVNCIEIERLTTFDDKNFPQSRTLLREGILEIGKTKLIHETNQEVLKLARKEPNCMDQHPFVIRVLDRMIKKYPDRFNQFANQQVRVPIRSKHKIKGEYHIPVLHILGLHEHIWKTEPLTKRSNANVALLARVTK